MRDLKKLQSHHSFKDFMRAHGKTYVDFEEYQKRFGIFKENMVKVQFLRETERATGVYGATKFADLTAEEFKERHLGLYPPVYDPVNNVYDSDLPDAEIPEIDLPKEFDWRQKGAVTPVKNQGITSFFSLQLSAFRSLYNPLFLFCRTFSSLAP